MPTVQPAVFKGKLKKVGRVGMGVPILIYARTRRRVHIPLCFLTHKLREDAHYVHFPTWLMVNQ